MDRRKGCRSRGICQVEGRGGGSKNVSEGRAEGGEARVNVS